MKNNIFKKLLVSGVLVLAPTIVNAKSANIDIDGLSNTTVNDMITLSIKVNNVDDANIVALGGDIMYDPEYLTLVNYEGALSPYNFNGNKISEGNYRIAGVDFTMNNAIKSETSVYTLTFKANKVGNTTVDFKNADVVDINEENIDTTTNTKSIEIKDLVKEVVEVPVVEEEKKETIVKAETKTEVKEQVVEKNEEKNNETNESTITTILRSIVDALKNIFSFLK